MVLLAVLNMTYGFLAEFEKTGPGTFVRLPDIVEPSAMVPEPSGFAITPGGDIVLGAATVILAMGQGRIAAAAINDYLAETS